MTTKITPPRRTPSQKPTTTKGGATKSTAAGGKTATTDKKTRPPLRWNLNTFLAFGAAIVILIAITFPVWRPLFMYDAIRDKFGTLAPEIQATIRKQPEEVQQAMLAMESANREMALNVIPAYLRPDVQINEPLPSGGFAAEIARGTLTGKDLLHSSSGTVVIYAISGSNFLRFEGIDGTWGPDLRVYFSAETDPLSVGLGGNYYEVSALRANVGTFNYRLPAGFSVYNYKSVVILDAQYQAVYGAAPLTFK